MTSIDDLQEEKKEITSDISNEEKEKNANKERTKKRLERVVNGLSLFAAASAMVVGVSHIREIERLDSEFFGKAQQILQTPGLSEAERKIKVLNDLSPYYNIKSLYKDQMIREIVDLGFDVIEKHTTADGKEKTVYDIVKR